MNTTEKNNGRKTHPIITAFFWLLFLFFTLNTYLFFVKAYPLGSQIASLLLALLYFPALQPLLMRMRGKRLGFFPRFALTVLLVFSGFYFKSNSIHLQNMDKMKEWAEASRAAAGSVEAQYIKEIKELDPDATLDDLPINPVKRLEQLAIKKEKIKTSQYKAFAQHHSQLINDLGDKISFTEPVKNFPVEKKSEKLNQLIAKSLDAYRAYRPGQEYREHDLFNALDFALEIDEPQYYNDVKALLESEAAQYRAMSVMGLYHAKKGDCDTSSAYIDTLTAHPEDTLSISARDIANQSLKFTRRQELIQTIANSKLLCAGLSKALDIYAQYNPEVIGSDKHQAVTIVSFGSILEMAGQSGTAHKFFTYAKEKARQQGNSAAILDGIAHFQTQAGLLDAAFETVAGIPLEKWLSTQGNYLKPTLTIRVLASEIERERGIASYKITNFNSPPSMEKLKEDLQTAKDKNKEHDIGRKVNEIAMRLFETDGADAALNFLTAEGKGADGALEACGTLKGHYTLSADTAKLEEISNLIQHLRKQEKSISYQMKRFLLEKGKHDLVESLLDAETNELDKIGNYLLVAQYRIGIDFKKKMNKTTMSFNKPYSAIEMDSLKSKKQ